MQNRPLRQTVIAFGCDEFPPAVNGALRYYGYQFQGGHFLPEFICNRVALIRRPIAPFEKVITFLHERIALVRDNGIRMILQLLDNPLHAFGYHAAIVSNQSQRVNSGNPLLAQLVMELI